MADLWGLDRQAQRGKQDQPEPVVSKDRWDYRVLEETQEIREIRA